MFLASGVVILLNHCNLKQFWKHANKRNHLNRDRSVKYPHQKHETHHGNKVRLFHTMFWNLLPGFPYKSLYFRVPKGFRAIGLWAKKCRAPWFQDRKIGALRLHNCPQGIQLARIIIFVQAPSSTRLWAPGLQ